MLSMGCDVMAQHCDTAYPQTLAQEKGVYGIGYNSDMSKETPDSCLTSVIWNWSAYYTSAVQSIMDGTWTGENYYGGMAEGLIQITDLASFAKEGTQEKVDEATTAILSGEKQRIRWCIRNKYREEDWGSKQYIRRCNDYRKH